MSLFNATDGTFFDFSEIFSASGSVLGGTEYVFAIIFACMALIIWRYDETGYGLTIFVIFSGLFGAVVFSSFLSTLFGIIMAIGIGALFYKIFQGVRQ